MKKLFFTICMALTLSLGAAAQILPSANPAADSASFAKVRARMDSIRQYRPTVGLVLAGGGARGLAHLGIIKYMEELGIPVDLVTGTSMGGLVGGMYALGYKHDQLDSLIRAINWPVMMSDNVPNDYLSYTLKQYRNKYIVRIPFHYDDEDLANRFEQEHVLEKMAEEAGHNSDDALSDAINKMGIGMPDGFLYGLNVRNTLSSVSVGYQDSISFANLPIPYACVATDMHAMTTKYWTSGNLTTAMRSTMAIPFYFRAVRNDGEILLDGGMRNNFPADLAREMGADIVIGSEMSTHRHLNELNTPMDFLFQTISLLSTEAVSQAREMLDLHVNHELKGYNMLSFDEKSVDDIINQGYQNAKDHKEVFEAIAKIVAGKEEPPVSHPTPAVNIAQSKVRVDTVKFTGLRGNEQKLLLRKKDYPADSLYDREIIERMLNNIYGTNAFEAVTYHLEGSHEPYALVFDCQKGQVHDFAFGIHADTDEYVYVGLHLGLGTRRLTGLRMSTDLKLGSNPALKIEGSYKPHMNLPAAGIVFRTRLLNSASGYMSTEELRLLSSGFDLFIDDARLRKGSMRIGLSAEMNPYERYLSYEDHRVRWDWKSYWLSTFATFKFDTFDDSYFPTRGVRLYLDGRYVFEGYSHHLDPDNYLHGEVTIPKGKIPDYWSIISSASAAFSIGENFTILPTLWAGWYATKGFYKELKDPDNQDWVEPYFLMNPMHVVTYGGFLPNRYTQYQIPFFGFPSAYKQTAPISQSLSLDLRYRFLHKNFVTVRGGLTDLYYTIEDLFYSSPIYAAGAEYARQSMVGPLKFAVQWNSLFGVNVYASVGFDF